MLENAKTSLPHGELPKQAEPLVRMALKRKDR